MRRIIGQTPRHRLLSGVLRHARSEQTSADQKHEAHEQLGGLLDVLDHRIDEPNGPYVGTIFTQTRLNFGYEPGTVSNEPPSPDRLASSAVMAVGGIMPYLGSAILYSELMGTGRFSALDFVDFRDEERVREAIQEKPDFAFVAGATTYDRYHVRDLNMRLAEQGIITVNGGVAPTLDPHPFRYVNDGTSVFRGEIEGAAGYLIDELVKDPSPRIFTRAGTPGKRSITLLNNPNDTVQLPVDGKVDMKDAYSEEHEVSGGNLARRLEALEMMRTGFSFKGKKYEIPSFLRVHQINTSFGCPERCSFCATEPFQGIEMRHRDLQSIETELIATEAKVVAIVDQNFTANGRDYFVSFLEMLKKHGKRFAYEGELMFYLEQPEEGNPQNFFFDGSPDDEYRAQLLKDTLLAVEVGLEQPVKVKGTITQGKNPDQYNTAIKRLNDLGIIVFGTAMVGLPEELWSPHAVNEKPIVPYESLAQKEWDEMISTWVEWSKSYPGLILFPFEPIPGTPAYRALEKKGLLSYKDGTENIDDTLRPLNLDPVQGIASRQALAKILNEIMSPKIRRTRLKQANFSPLARLFMEVFNRGSSRAFGSRMQ